MKQLPQPSPSNSGQGLTEYLILLVLISLVSIAAVRSLGGTIQRKLSMVRSHIEGVSTSDKTRDRDG
jgi:Flp pilus assembly pilin Flp